MVGRTGALIRLALTHPVAGPGFPTLLITSRERTSGPAFDTHLHQDSVLLPSNLPLGQSKYGMTNDSDGKESTCNAGGTGSILGLRRPLEKGMAIHASILAWRIPWTEEPCGLQSMGLQRVGHD